MTPSVRPHLRAFPVVLLSSALPDHICQIQRGADDILEIDQGIFEPVTPWPLCLSLLYSMSTKIFHKLPSSIFANGIKEKGDCVLERRTGFTLSDGPWWYRIIELQKPDATNGDTTSANNENTTEHTRDRVHTVLLESLAHVISDPTSSYWKDWKALYDRVGYNVMVGDLTLGPKTSTKEVIILVIHNRQKSHDDRDLQLYLRGSANTLGKSYNSLPGEAQMTPTFIQDHAGPIATGSSEPFVLLTRSRSNSMVNHTTIAPKTDPARYIPPHRQQLSQTPKSQEEPQDDILINLDGTIEPNHTLLTDDTLCTDHVHSDPEFPSSPPLLPIQRPCSQPKLGSWTPPAQKTRPTDLERQQILSRAVDNLKSFGDTYRNY